MPIHPTLPANTLDEPALVERVLGGGERGDAAFEVLVHRHQAWLVRYLLYLLHSTADADEVAQRVFIQAFLRLGQYHGGDLRSWLRRIATRLAFNFRRDEATRRGYEARAEVLQSLRGPEEDLAAREALLLTLGAMSYPEREILVLRHVEELSLREIAAQLDIGLSAAKMRLKRAREGFMRIYGTQTRNGDGHAT